MKQEYEKSADRFVIISGCSGGGKSTLVTELARRGYSIVEEPGRRIVREELEATGASLPWVDEIAFGLRAIEMALKDFASASAFNGWVFFDRSVVDAATALDCLTGKDYLNRISRLNRYNRRVFMAPPWPEIFAADKERRHDMKYAVAEYERLIQSYPALGYDIILLPKVSVRERADFVLHNLWLDQ